jgi:hypothetical protein
MLGQIWNLDLHRKNLAGTIDAGGCPVEKHRPVCFGSFRPCGNRNIIIEDCFEMHANAIDLAALYDRLAHGESLRNLVERQIGEIEGEYRLGLAKKKLDMRTARALSLLRLDDEALKHGAKRTNGEEGCDSLARKVATSTAERLLEAAWVEEGWRPVGVSNPCFRRERPASWATRRTGRSVPAKRARSYSLGG